MVKSKLILKTITTLIFLTSLTAVIAEAQNQTPPPPAKPAAPQPAAASGTPPVVPPQVPPSQGAPGQGAPQGTPGQGAKAEPPHGQPAVPHPEFDNAMARSAAFRKDSPVKPLDFRSRDAIFKKLFPKEVFPSIDDELNEYIKTKNFAKADLSNGSEDLMQFCIFAADKYQEKIKTSYRGMELENYFLEVCATLPPFNFEPNANPMVQVGIYKNLMVSLLNVRKTTLDNLPFKASIDREISFWDDYIYGIYARVGLSRHQSEVTKNIMALLAMLFSLAALVKVFFFNN